MVNEPTQQLNASYGDVASRLHQLDIDVQKNKTFSTIAQGVVVVIIVAVMGWVATEIQTLGKTMIKVEISLDTIDSRLLAQERINNLELDRLKAQLLKEVEANSEVSEDNRRLLNQVWPRLRAMGENLQLLKQAYEREHPTHKLHFKNPEKF